MPRLSFVFLSSFSVCSSFMRWHGVCFYVSGMHLHGVLFLFFGYTGHGKRDTTGRTGRDGICECRVSQNAGLGGQSSCMGGGLRRVTTGYDRRYSTAHA